MTVTPDYAARNALDAAIWTSDLDADERLALHGFRYFVNRPHGLAEVWVPRAILKCGTGLPSRRAQRAMDGLVGKGWLEVVKPGAGTRATVYRIVLGGSCDPTGGIASGRPSDPVSAASDPVSAASDPTGGMETQNSVTHSAQSAGSSGMTATDPDHRHELVREQVEANLGGFESDGEEAVFEALFSSYDDRSDSALAQIITNVLRKQREVDW